MRLYLSGLPWSLPPLDGRVSSPFDSAQGLILAAKSFAHVLPVLDCPRLRRFHGLIVDRGAVSSHGILRTERACHNVVAIRRMATRCPCKYRSMHAAPRWSGHSANGHSMPMQVQINARRAALERPLGEWPLGAHASADHCTPRRAGVAIRRMATPARTKEVDMPWFSGTHAVRPEASSARDRQASSASPCYGPTPAWDTSCTAGHSCLGGYDMLTFSAFSADGRGDRYIRKHRRYPELPQRHTFWYSRLNGPSVGRKHC